MTYYVYILQSVTTGMFYIGQTQNLEKRLAVHNSGYSTFTSNSGAWNLVWYTQVESRKEAFGLEKRLKSLKSRARLIKYMSENQGVQGSENLQISNLLDFRESS